MQKKLSEESCIKLLNSIESFLKAEEDETKTVLEEAEFEAVEFLSKQIIKFEKDIKALLDKQKKHFTTYFLSRILKRDMGSVLISQFIRMLFSDAAEADKFEEEMSETAKEFMTHTVSELSREIMKSIDEDIVFNTLSVRTTNWIESWSSELGTMMKLNSHQAVESALINNMQVGKGLTELIVELENLPQFDYVRARRTAITETLTAYSQAQHESYKQSPSVTGKTWKHSGSRGIKPRPHHVALSGTTVSLDERFIVGSEYANFPRDPDLSAKERVNCHCTLGPSVDSAILGLTKEEKEILRQQALAEMGH